MSAMEEDPRTRWLLAVAREQVPAALVGWLLRSLDTLEQTDFGEIEPVGVGAPIPRDG